jgi:hypothetical protein
LTKFNSKIGLKFNSIELKFNFENGVQIGGEGIQNLLVNMVLKKYFFHASLLKEWAKIWWEKISWDLIVILPKSNPMNRYHWNFFNDI